MRAVYGAPPSPFLGRDAFSVGAAQEDFATDLDQVLAKVRELLVTKNIAYGDSALDPVRVLSKASAEEQIRVRIDDKLSRLARGSDAGEDVLHDLLGYFVLLEIARLRAGRKAAL